MTPMVRPMISASHAQALLGPHDGALIQVILEPWSRWRRLGHEQPLFALPLGESERAQILHAHMRFEAKQVFDSVPGVTATDALEFFALIFQPNVLLRFKYVEGGPQNAQTEQQKHLHRQEYTAEMMGALALDGLENPPTLLTLGYRLSADASSVSEIVVRRDLKFHPTWEYTIYGASAGQMAEPQTLPVGPKPEPARLSSKLGDRRSKQG